MGRGQCLRAQLPLQGTPTGTEGKDPPGHTQGARESACWEQQRPRVLWLQDRPLLSVPSAGLWSVSLKGQRSPALGDRSWGGGRCELSDSHLRGGRSVIKLLPPPTAGNRDPEGHSPCSGAERTDSSSPGSSCELGPPPGSKLLKMGEPRSLAFLPADTKYSESVKCS